MDTEEVIVHLEKDSYTVDAVFQMVNSGDTVTEWVGFPKGHELAGPEMGKFPDFTRFHAWVDGRQVEFSNEGDRWLAGRVKFPGHTTTLIRVVYEANYYRGEVATYFIGTGSLWKDSIRKAAFTVDGSAIGGSKHFSAGLHMDRPNSRRLLSEKALRIEVADYEPNPKAVLNVDVGR